jgi:hypothetical protein
MGKRAKNNKYSADSSPSLTADGVLQAKKIGKKTGERGMSMMYAPSHTARL